MTLPDGMTLPADLTKEAVTDATEGLAKSSRPPA